MMRLNLSAISATVSLFLFLASLSYGVSSKTIVEEADVSLSEPAATLGKPSGNARSRYLLPKLFEFDRFKKAFKRVYNSILEEVARKRLYLARALRVFLSAVGYKHGKRSSYLAINYMSDWTPGEIKRLYLDGPKFLEKLGAQLKGINIEEEMRNEQQNIRLEDNNGVIPAIGENEIEESLELCAEHPDEPGYREILEELENVKPRRRKRSSIEPVRSLDIDGLFRDPTTLSESQTTDRVPSNNPNYIPPELSSFSGEENDGILSYMPKSLANMIVNAPGISYAANVFRSISSNFLGAPNAPSNRQTPSQSPYIQDTNGPPIQLQNNRQQQASWQDILDNPMQFRQQEALKRYEENFKRQRSYKRKCVDRQPSVRKSPAPSPDVPSTQPNPVQTQEVLLDDEVFIDHRESNCLLEIRRQHGCGACYAFATIALYEWTYCKQTGNRVAFSEQYIVDCGKAVGLDGCDGGIFTNVSDFVNKFGLELRANYPYRHKEDECPYEPEQIENNPQSMGYLRVGEQKFNFVSIKNAESVLKDKPMVTNIEIPTSFSEYGGGIDTDTDCQPESVHSMLLVGHGREDNQEYWLIRNSHGLEWGHDGYYKMGKTSPCMRPKFGFLLEANFDGDIKKNMNENYDIQKIKRRYWDYIKSDIETSSKRSRLS